MAIDLQALKTELATDPEGLGYENGLNDDSDAKDAELLNQPRPTIQVNRTAIPMGEVYGEVDWDDEWVNLTDVKRAAFRQITSTDSLNVSSQHIRDAFVTIFGSGSATLANLQAILTRDGSRLEELFGAGSRVTPSEVAKARGS